MKTLRFSTIVAAALVGLATVACAAASAQSAPTPASQPPTPTATTQPVQYTGSFALSPKHAPAGATVTATGSGLPANTTLDVVWHTVEGSWKLDGSYQESFKGRDFKPVTQKVGSATTDSTGKFQTTFTVPEGFGFQHDVTLEQGGTVRNQASFDVDMQVSISPTSGPPGTPITITANGVGWQYLYNVWQVVYDNKFTGWISSVTTGGIAKAVIPATGKPGKHLVQVMSGTPTFPYLNTQQSPTPDRPSFTLEFTVTDGPPVLPADAETQGLQPDPGKAPSTTGPALWTDPASGRIGTSFTLHGQGLPAGQPLDLLWFRVVGNRMSGQGWEEKSVSLGTVTPKADGSFELSLKAPDDLGGPHRIEAQSQGKKVAETNFTVTPSAMALQPASGPVGTPFTVHLKGGGWTETANIYLLVYDNAYLGYACAFNSQGDVTINLPAAGSPGWHFIDLYPGIYKGEDAKGVENFRVPQLTVEDHPGEKLPAFHFAFQVTGP
jgi:hypothetical protein